MKTMRLDSHLPVTILIDQKYHKKVIVADFS